MRIRSVANEKFKEFRFEINVINNLLQSCGTNAKVWNASAPTVSSAKQFRWWVAWKDSGLDENNLREYVYRLRGSALEMALHCHAEERVRAGLGRCDLSSRSSNACTLFEIVSVPAIMSRLWPESHVLMGMTTCPRIKSALLATESGMTTVQLHFYVGEKYLSRKSLLSAPAWDYYGGMTAPGISRRIPPQKRPQDAATLAQSLLRFSRMRIKLSASFYPTNLSKDSSEDVILNDVKLFADALKLCSKLDARWRGPFLLRLEQTSMSAETVVTQECTKRALQSFMESVLPTCRGCLQMLILKNIELHLNLQLTTLIGQCVSLEKLVLHNVELTVMGTVNLVQRLAAHCPRLSYLGLADAGFHLRGDDGLGSFSKRSNWGHYGGYDEERMLVEATFLNFPFFLRALKQCYSLANLHLVGKNEFIDGNSSFDDFAKGFCSDAFTTSLEHLDLSSCFDLRASGDGLKSLPVLSNLVTLVLTDTSLCDTGLQGLANGILAHPAVRLKTLRLGYNSKITAEGMPHLSTILSVCHNLSTLSLSHCGNIGDEGISLLSPSLHSVTDLNLSELGLGPAGIGALFAKTSAVCRLKSLFLAQDCSRVKDYVSVRKTCSKTCSNKVNLQSMAKIAKGIQHMTSLTALNVYQEKKVQTTNGLQTLFSALTKQTCLTGLRLPPLEHKLADDFRDFGWTYMPHVESCCPNQMMADEGVWMRGSNVPRPASCKPVHAEHNFPCPAFWSYGDVEQMGSRWSEEPILLFKLDESSTSLVPNRGWDRLLASKSPVQLHGDDGVTFEPPPDPCAKVAIGLDGKSAGKGGAASSSTQRDQGDPLCAAETEEISSVLQKQWEEWKEKQLPEVREFIDSQARVVPVWQRNLSGVGPATCPVCNREFGSSSALNDHLRDKKDAAHMIYRATGQTGGTSSSLRVPQGSAAAAVPTVTASRGEYTGSNRPTPAPRQPMLASQASGLGHVRSMEKAVFVSTNPQPQLPVFSRGGVALSCNFMTTRPPSPPGLPPGGGAHGRDDKRQRTSR